VDLRDVVVAQDCCCATWVLTARDVTVAGSGSACVGRTYHGLLISDCLQRLSLGSIAVLVVETLRAILCEFECVSSFGFG
jgi:hypothetical protein